MKNKNKKIKIRIIICSIILICFALYNIFWYVCSYRPYLLLCEAVGQDEVGDYYCVKDDISYYVDKPNYLSMVGNLAIGPAVIGDGQDVVNMIIWRNLDGTYTVGISLDSYEVEVDGSVTTTSVKFEIDEQMKLLEKDEAVQQILDENKEVIEKYYNLAYEMWGILKL